MYKLEFYVPESHLQEVKNAVFEAGGGVIGDYDRCCWETSGTGQFRPGEAADPFLGSAGNLEKIREIKVELVCADENIRESVKALLNAHPYQTPAFQYWKVNDDLD
jgi:hypothetical protein